MKEWIKRVVDDNKEKLPDGVGAIIKSDNGSGVGKPVVNIYVWGKCEMIKENRSGRYVVFIKGEYKEKILYATAEHTTSNSMIIIGLIEALKLVTVPYDIKFYTHASIGFKKAYGKNKGPNADLLTELKKLLEQGGHDLEKYIGDEMQEELKRKLPY